MCAYIAWLNSQQNPGTFFQFMPFQPSDPAPNVSLVKGKHVIFADICWSKEKMDEYEQNALSLLVLDHHETNQKALEGASYAKFDMNKSACMLVWQLFFPLKPMPVPLYYIGMKDIWIHKQSMVAEAFMLACPNQAEFPTFLDFHTFISDPKAVAKTIEKGMHLFDYQEAKLKEMASAATTHIWNGVPVILINASWPWTSDLGHYLCQEKPDHVVMLWTKKPKSPFNVSLRSHDQDGPNVALLAQTMKGGGHAHAASFRMNELPETLFSSSL